MEWSVVKIGIAQFDILHAYGLGILLATACGEPVELCETSSHYVLSSPVKQLPHISCNKLLGKVLPLAREEDLQAYAHGDLEQYLPLTVLDGLLAALFTTPGLRVPSVSELLKKQRLDAKAMHRGLHKAANCIDRWRSLAVKAAHGKEEDWLPNVLDDYNLKHPAHPIITVGKSEKDINVLMMIDPAFSFSLRTQGQQQSLSLESGVLDSGWLISLHERIGTGVINWWRALLSQQGAHDEQEFLLDCLKRRDADAWINHLNRVAQRTNMFTESNTRRYSLAEVRAITEAMHNAEHIPLKRVLERERGTLCFGRALRQIGRYNPSRLRDLLEDLEEVQTRAQLFPVLQRIVLASEIEKEKKRKIIVPTEVDLAALLDDIDQYGIPELVGLLLVLSALRYPSSENALKYELSTLIRVLIVLAVQNGPVHVPVDDQSPLSHELFIDDPEVPGGSLGEQEEL